MKRPERKAIPLVIKRAVVRRQKGLCKCGCGQTVSEKPKTNTHFDHEPALRLREINRTRTGYIPHQHDPRYIDARCPGSHRVKTHGAGATTAGTDTGKIKKERKREREAGKKKVSKWIPRKMQSRGFAKGHRPMRTR